MNKTEASQFLRKRTSIKNNENTRESFGHIENLEQICKLLIWVRSSLTVFYQQDSGSSDKNFTGRTQIKFF